MTTPRTRAVGDERDQEQQDGEPDAGDDDRALPQLRALLRGAGAARRRSEASSAATVARIASNWRRPSCAVTAEASGAPDHVLEVARVAVELAPQLGRACALGGVVGHRRERRELPRQLTARRVVRLQERAVGREQEAARAGLQILREPLDALIALRASVTSRGRAAPRAAGRAAR